MSDVAYATANCARIRACAGVAWDHHRDGVRRAFQREPPRLCSKRRRTPASGSPAALVLSDRELRPELHHGRPKPRIGNRTRLIREFHKRGRAALRSHSALCAFRF